MCMCRSILMHRKFWKCIHRRVNSCLWVVRTMNIKVLLSFPFVLFLLFITFLYHNKNQWLKLKEVLNSLRFSWVFAEVEESKHGNRHLPLSVRVESGTQRSCTERLAEKHIVTLSSSALRSQAPFISSWLVSAEKTTGPDIACLVKLLWFSRDGNKVIFNEVFHPCLIFLRVLGKNYDIKAFTRATFHPIVDLETEHFKYLKVCSLWPRLWTGAVRTACPVYAGPTCWASKDFHPLLLPSDSLRTQACKLSIWLLAAKPTASISREESLFIKKKVWSFVIFQK